MFYSLEIQREEMRGTRHQSHTSGTAYSHKIPVASTVFPTTYAPDICAHIYADGSNSSPPHDGHADETTDGYTHGTTPNNGYTHGTTPTMATPMGPPLTMATPMGPPPTMPRPMGPPHNAHGNPSPNDVWTTNTTIRNARATPTPVHSHSVRARTSIPPDIGGYGGYSQLPPPPP